MKYYSFPGSNFYLEGFVRIWLCIAATVCRETCRVVLRYGRYGDALSEIWQCLKLCVGVCRVVYLWIILEIIKDGCACPNSAVCVGVCQCLCLSIGDVSDRGSIQLYFLVSKRFAWRVVFVWVCVTCICVGGVSMEWCNCVLVSVVWCITLVVSKPLRSRTDWLWISEQYYFCWCVSMLEITHCIWRVRLFIFQGMLRKNV